MVTDEHPHLEACHDSHWTRHLFLKLVQPLSNLFHTQMIVSLEFDPWHRLIR